MSKSKITAFHGIFEERLKKLVKHIKHLRKDPTAKSQLKQLVIEAKDLKKLIKIDKPGISNHTIEIAYNIENGILCIDQVSSPTHCENIDIRCAGGLIILDFEVITKI